MNMRQPGFSVLLVVIVFLWMGCGETTNQNSNVEASDVAGTYTIHQYEFIPQASALDPINLLKHLEKEGTILQLTQSKDFIFTYRTQDGNEAKLTGPFDLTSDLVTLKGQEKDEAQFNRILLDQTFSLDRATANTLRFENRTEITPEVLGSFYEGMNQVEGTLRLEFVREGESEFASD